MNISLALEGDFKPFEKILNSIDDYVFTNQDDPIEGLEEFQLLHSELRQVLSDPDQLSHKEAEAADQMMTLMVQGIQISGLIQTLMKDFNSALQGLIQIREEFAEC